MRRLERRDFLRTGAAAGAIAAWPRHGRAQPARKKVALVATTVFKYSHAQHFIDRFLEGYGWEGQHHRPPLDLVALYVDQIDNKDLARERSERRGVKIYPSIAEALCLGGPKLAVDGVVIIGEHGRYPANARGQRLYPRYKFFKQVVKVFESSGRTVPVFNDKHLSTDFREAREMVADSKRLKFPFMAGSSLPVTWRIPSLELPTGVALEESVAVGYGGVDSYDFHVLETGQCMSERRAGGEAGVRAVHALRGPKVWAMLRERPTTARLLLAAIARSHTLTPPAGTTVVEPTLEHAERVVKDPVGYFFEHRDGFRSSAFLMGGLIDDFNYATLSKDDGRVQSCQMYLPMPPRHTTLADFFNPLFHHMEDMIVGGQTPFPVERTLLTTGMLASALESLYRGQTRIETPELDVTYPAPKASTYWRA
jgi:hypothetical protein